MRRATLVLSAAAVLVLCAAGVSPATAAAAPEVPVWLAGSESFPTNLAPGGTGAYVLHVRNVGTAATDGSSITVVDHLPPGLTATSAYGAEGFAESVSTSEEFWQCSGTGTSVVTCTNNPAGLPTVAPGPEGHEGTAPYIVINVAIETGHAPETVPNLVSISGGGALEATNTIQTSISSSLAAFGLASFQQLLLGRDGSPATAAGSHPYQSITTFVLNSRGRVGEPRVLPEEVKDLEIALPPGLVGNPTATPRCSKVQFDAGRAASTIYPCPADTQVGTEVISEAAGGASNFVTVFPVYNLQPPPGYAAQFGFSFQSLTGFIDFGLRSGEGYAVKAVLRNLLQVSVLRSSLILWGQPTDPSHDAERNGGASVPPSSVPLLTNPTSCGAPLNDTLSMDSWEAPAAQSAAPFSYPFTASYPLTDNLGNPLQIEGCDKLHFEPTFTARPDAGAADTPTGLHVDLHIPQNEEPEGLATSHLRAATVTLPAGLTVNPASANGLAACSSAQIGLSDGEAPTCPDAAKLGTVEVKTPLLDHPLHGAVYLAAQNDNPFHSLLAIYIAVDDPQSGVVLKLAGHVQADPSTGRLTTTFEENPQLPFEDLKLDFFEGARAPLRTPSACATYTTTTDLVPWSGGPDANPSDSFRVTSGPNGGPCLPASAQRPLNPSFEGGTLNPVGGAFSPFVLNLKREDGQQEFSSLNVSTPPGVAADLRGVPYCSDAALAAAASRSGAAEQASPSCPAASQIGTVNVGAGAGPDPYYVGGKVYLSGPYKSAPLSLAIVTPALAGPFDLGTVVVRSALQVNPETAQITVRSDPLPRILDGIPLDLRDLRVAIDRPHFTNNPTDCEPMSLFADVFGSSGAAARLSNRFQVLDCGALGFKPSLALSLKGPTKRAGNPALKAVVTYPKQGGYANIASAQVTLPHGEFLDNAHIQTVCTRVQFEAKACPPASVYGHATAITPLLDQPLSGPVYLRSSTNKLPDLVADLNGQIEVTLDGKIDTGRGGGIRNTFQAVPDAPVSKFTLTMKGGKKGLLVNSENICRKPQRAVADFTAQNGKVYDTEPVVGNSCHHRARHRRRGGKR